MQKAQKRRPSKFQAKPKPNHPPGEVKILEVPNPTKVRVRNFFGNQDNQIFTLRFSNDDKLLATGTIEGQVKIYDVYDGKNISVARSWRKQELPTTSVRWRPKQGSDDSNYLAATSAQGSVTWLKSTGELIGRIETNSPVMCSDYSYTGQFLVVGKDDSSVQVFNDQRRQGYRLYSGSTMENESRNHSNRVFSIKCLPQSNQFISGGWDSNVKIWDMREKQCVRTIYGPHLSGDSLDFKNGIIISGSYRNKQILQLWDYGSGKLIQNVDLGLQNYQASYCYSVQFGQRFIGTGLSGSNQVVLCDTENNNRVCGRIQLNEACYSLDFSNNGKVIACAGGEGVVYVLAI